MNERTLSPWNIAAGAVVIGGGLVFAMPQHVVGIVQLVIVTIAAAAGLYALAANVPPTGWMSPFKWMSPFSPRSAPATDGHVDDLDVIRSQLAGRRQPVDGAPPMPAEALHLLKPLIAAMLDVPADEAARSDAARSRLSPLAWAILTTDPTRRPPWFRTLAPSEGEVAEVLHRVLDELEELAAAGLTPSASSVSIHPEAT